MLREGPQPVLDSSGLQHWHRPAHQQEYTVKVACVALVTVDIIVFGPGGVEEKDVWNEDRWSSTSTATIDRRPRGVRFSCPRRILRNASVAKTFGEPPSNAKALLSTGSWDLEQVYRTLI